MASITNSSAFSATEDDLVKFSGSATIRKLSAVNYNSWKIKMEMILIRERLWPVVCQRKVRPSDTSSDKPTPAQLEYDDEAERATATLFLCLGDAPLRHVMALRNPVQVWVKLKELYTSVGFFTRFFIWRHLFNARAESHKDMGTLIDNLRLWQIQLKESGGECPEEILCGVLLNALPEIFSAWITVYTQQYREAKTVSFDDLAAQLLNENRRLTERDLNPLGEKFIGGQAYAARDRKGGPTCWYCKRSGHREDRCWEKHPELRPASRAAIAQVVAM